jgi:hypothetical protein
MRTRLPYFLIFVLTCLGSRLVASDTLRADLLVYHATPAGIAAALAAPAELSVILIDPTPRIGGLLTAGLSNSDFRSYEALTGFYRDFCDRVWAYYRETYGAESPQARDCRRGTLAEPKVNLLILEQMLAERTNVRILIRTELTDLQLTGWIRGRRRIQQITVAGPNGREIPLLARQYIDASYEGDLLARAGESFHVGRESAGQYGEPGAGDVDGKADGQVQGYNFRFVMTRIPENRRYPDAPTGYRREDFTGVLPHFATGRLKHVFSPRHDGIFRAHEPPLPNGKADINDTPRAPVRLSMPDINDGYPLAGPEERDRIVARHFYFQVGLLYFLQNDPEVPPKVRTEAREWGLCRDEFTETDGYPPRLYIREGRRLIGQHVFSGRDTESPPNEARTKLHPTSIAAADYVHNCHGTGRIGTRYNGEHTGEFYRMIPPLQVPYGVIVPQKTENLLVPVACSASHFGFGALRLEPTWAGLGQAAGVAAGLAIRNGVAVQEVEVTALQEHLHGAGAATIYVSDLPPDHSDFRAVQWWGVRGGLHGLAGGNQPKAVSTGGQYSEAHPGHAVELDKPLTAELRKRWEQLLPSPLSGEFATRGEWIRATYAARGH